MALTVEAMADVVGKVIRDECPYVKVLAMPRLEVYEGLPGTTYERWEALAQVDGWLCIIELKVTEAHS